MMFKTAYETTACVGYKLDKTISALKAAQINGEVIALDFYNIYSLIGSGASSNDVPSFVHPLLIDDKFYIDVRSFGKYDQNQRDFIVRNKVDYDFMYLRAKLNSLWVGGHPEWLRDISPLPIAVFASWISESVGKRFALDPKEQFDLGILAAIFYISQFSDDVELTERDKLRVVNSVTRALRASTQDVLEIIDKVSVINNIFEFCSHAQEITGSVRLKDFSPGLLTTLVGSTWYGPNAKEILAVAIEHPPTWISIMLTSIDERTFKNSQIARIITDRSTFKKLSDDFIRAITNLLRVA